MKNLFSLTLQFILDNLNGGLKLNKFQLFYGFKGGNFDRNTCKRSAYS